MQKIHQIDVSEFVRQSNIHTLLVQYGRRRLRLSIFYVSSPDSLWTTAQRREHLVYSKDFICNCDRYYCTMFFLGSCVPWRMRPLDDESLTDVSRPWTAYLRSRSTFFQEKVCYISKSDKTKPVFLLKGQQHEIVFGHIFFLS